MNNLAFDRARHAFPPATTLDTSQPRLDDYEPIMTKDEYLAFMRSNSREETFKDE